MDDIIWVIGILAGALTLGIIGALVGDLRGRQALGFWLGFILGPIGIIVAASLADERFKCPECGGAVVPGKPRCKNCGADIPIPTSASIPRPRIVRPTPRIRTPMKAQGEP